MARLLIFGAGVYIGIYCAQNYQIDKVPGPNELMEKMEQFAKDYGFYVKPKDK